MTAPQAALTFVALLVIVNPLALAPVFGALTRGMAPGRARRTAAVAVLAGFGLIGAAGLAGHAALRAIGAEVALAEMAVAGVLLVVGLAMLLGHPRLARVGSAPHDPALVPLATPLIAGPGAMGAMVMFSGRDAGDPIGIFVLYMILALVGALTFALLLAAEPMTRRLGPRGVALISRGLGLALIAAAARLLYEALRDHAALGPAGAG